MSDYQGAAWSPNNNWDPDQGPKDHIVIHGTAGGTSAEGIAQHFRATEGTTGPVSTQYIVDQIGNVVQTVLERNVAWGNGTYPMNIRGISIEHVKSTPDNSAELTPIQEQTSFKLIQDIRTRHNIPIENIIPHSAVVATACPGPYPFDRMRNYLNGGQQPMSNTPSGWSDDGHTLKAPNGTPVVLGFRDHVLTSNWDASNWPLEAEHHASPVEQSHPSLGGGQVQTFRWKRLEFTASSGIIEGWLGLELVWYQQQHALLVAQVAALQAEITALQQQPIAATLAQIGSLATQASTALAKIGTLAAVQ